MNAKVVIAVAALALESCASTSRSARSELNSPEFAKAQALRSFSETCSLDAPPNAQPPPSAPAPPPTVQLESMPFTPGLFLDTALFLLPTTHAATALASHRNLARDADVRLLGTPHLTATFDATSRAVLEDDTGPLAEARFREISATPRQTADARLVIEVDTVVLLPTRPNAAPGTPRSQLHFVTAPVAGQTVALLARIPERPDQSVLLLLKPYPLRSESDLRAIFLCKMAERQRTLASLR